MKGYERKLVLRPIPLHLTDQDILNLCRPYAQINRVSRARFGNNQPKRSYNVYVPTEEDAQALRTLHNTLVQGQPLDVTLVPLTDDQRYELWMHQTHLQLGQTNQETRYLIRRVGQVLGTQFIEETVVRTLNLYMCGGYQTCQGKQVATIPAIFKALIHNALISKPEAWDKTFHTPVPEAELATA